MVGMPRRSPLTGRHARAGVSFLAVAVILAATSVSVGLAVAELASTEWRETVSTATHAMEFAAVWVALPLGVVLVLTAGDPPRWRVAVAVAAALAAPVLVQLSGVAASPLVILLALAAAVAGYALVFFGLAEHRLEPVRPARVRTAALLLGAANLGVIAIGMVHLLVWNPLARVPALDLEQMRLILAEGGAGIEPGPLAWGAVSVVVTVVAVGAALLAARRGTANAHAVVTGGLLLVHATSFFLWWAGIGIGERLAATFDVPASEAAPAGSLVALLGGACLAAAILMQLRPAAVSADVEFERDDDLRPVFESAGLRDDPAPVPATLTS